MYYGEIKKCDIANGEGVRVSLFVSGCTHHCPGCFNQDTWDFGYGKEYTDETEREILDALSPEYVNGLSLLGGEPFEPQNQQVLVQLLRKVREQYPEKNIWCYTGYLYDKELLSESRARCEYTDEMLSMIDVLVDGRFVEALKDIRLVFRGSSNQRIIDVKKSMESGEIILWEPKDRYEVNNDYREVLEKAGLHLAGLSPDKRIVEMIEITDHPFYVGTQAHPEFKSRPNRPHPLFAGFVKAAAEHQK